MAQVRSFLPPACQAGLSSQLLLRPVLAALGIWGMSEFIDVFM